MISILIGVLYVVLVIACLFLALLILMQLPKKDAGAGMAFGGGAGEALFGAGSGNVLTKLTKYIAAMFIILSLFLSVIVSSVADRGISAIDEGLSQESGATGASIPSETAAGQTPPSNAIPGPGNEAAAPAESGESNNAASNPPVDLDLQTDPPKETPVPDSSGEFVEDPAKEP